MFSILICASVIERSYIRNWYHFSLILSASKEGFQKSQKKICLITNFLMPRKITSSEKVGIKYLKIAISSTHFYDIWIRLNKFSSLWRVKVEVPYSYFKKAREQITRTDHKYTKDYFICLHTCALQMKQLTAVSFLLYLCDQR